jgi:hypothetical protein
VTSPAGPAAGGGIDRMRLAWPRGSMYRHTTALGPCAGRPQATHARANVESTQCVVLIAVRARVRTGPPSSSYTGTPSALPLMSHSAMSIAEMAPLMAAPW